MIRTDDTIPGDTTSPAAHPRERDGQGEPQKLPTQSGAPADTWSTPTMPGIYRFLAATLGAGAGAAALSILMRLLPP